MCVCVCVCVCVCERVSPLLLRHPPVDANGGEVLLHQELSQSDAALHRLDEDHHLEEKRRY